MPEPYNYYTPFANPLAAGLAGVDMAQRQQQNRMALDQQRMAMEEEQRKQQRREQYQQDLLKLTENPFSSAQDYIKLQSMYPEAMEAIKRVQQSRSTEQLQNDVEQVQKVGSALAAGKTDIAKNQLMEYRNALENSGRKSESASLDNIMEMMDENPNAVGMELNKYLLAQMGPQEFTSYFERVSGIGSGMPSVVKSEIYPDGTTLNVMSRGTPVVIDASGEQLSGQAAADAIKKAQEYGSDLAKRINFNRQQGTLEAQKDLKAEVAGEVKQAENAAKTSQEFFDKYDKIQANIRTLDEGINIIENGIKEGRDLGVGPIRKYFPSWGVAANQLKNVSGRLGLDVVSSVTFGALSEAELKMAMDTAMPVNLKGRALLDWMKGRKAAQEKLSDYLSSAAQFIGSPKEGGGVNTAADWMAINQARKKPAPKPDLKNQSTADLFKQLQNTMGQ
jgi:hypothetical protein